MKTHIFRLTPGQELRAEIQKFARENEINAGFIITCVAGLEGVVLRMADATAVSQDFLTLDEKLELVSLVGTVEKDNCHLHASVSDKNGRVYGGHLKSARIAVTAEVVIGEDVDKVFSREPDQETGFNELVVHDA